MSDYDWYLVTIVTNILVGIATLPFFSTELQQKYKILPGILLYLFAWTIFGPILFLWALGYGIFRYYILWHEFIDTCKKPNN